MKAHNNANVLVLPARFISYRMASSIVRTWLDTAFEGGPPPAPDRQDALPMSPARQGLSHDIADYPDGIVLPIDKPYRWTSADVIRKVKFAAIKHFRKKNLKVGHAGTLDPLATGVLLVCIGPACKRAQEFQDHDKEYVAGISFGATTPSYDLEKEVDRTFPYDHVTELYLRGLTFFLPKKGRKRVVRLRMRMPRTRLWFTLFQT